MIRVLFFAGLREQLGCDSLSMEAESLSTLEGVRQALSHRGEKWALALGDSRLQMALNQQLSTPDAPVQDGDEVAFFPPVTGG